MSLIIPKSDKKTIAKIEAAIEAAYHEGEAKLKGNGRSVPALSVLKTPLRDGDTERPDDEAYADSYFVNANSTTAPGIVDADCQPIIDTSEVYSGVYGRASINFYAFNSNGNTRAVEYGLSGTGKISVSGECVPGVTDVPLVETSTSSDLISWSDWAAVGADAKMPSPARAYIRFRVTLTTMDAARTPKLTDIRIYDIPKSPYEKIGYARPVVLDASRYAALESRMDSLEKERERKGIQYDIFSGFLAGLSETGELPVDFNEKLFHRLVDYATVYPDGRVVFTFRNGAEVSTKI